MIFHNGYMMGLGEFIEVYPFEMCHIPHVVTFSLICPSLKLKLPIYEIILSAQRSKGAIICPFTNPK